MTDTVEYALYLPELLQAARADGAEAAVATATAALQVRVLWAQGGEREVRADPGRFTRGWTRHGWTRRDRRCWRGCGR